ncbi:MAG: MBL fold metallo-hydrolase [Opitutaceae bacterium]
MNIYQISLVLVLSSLQPIAAIANHHGESAVKIEATQVAENIYMLTGQGGNIGLAVDERYTLMIDNQFANLSESIKAKIATISDKPIAYLLNTHFHFDHTDGNANFSSDVGVIVAHENVRSKLQSGTTIKAFGKQMVPYEPSALPALTFNDKLALHQASEAIQLIHFANAHTDGDIAVFFKDSNVVHTGDLYFSGFYPFIDTSNGGSIHGFIKAQEAILELVDDETRIIPGHGPLSTQADLQRDLNMLKDFVATVEAELAAGKGASEIEKHKAIQAIAGTHGGGFLSTEKFLSIVIDGLK